MIRTSVFLFSISDICLYTSESLMGLSVYLACLFSKIWNTLIQLMYIKTFMRTLLMSLSANFTFMSVLSLHQMINLFPHYELHFPASLHVYYFFFFRLDARRCTFCLVEWYTYFCFPINIHELCSGSQLNYLKTIWLFQISFLRYVM